VERGLAKIISRVNKFNSTRFTKFCYSNVRDMVEKRFNEIDETDHLYVKKLITLLNKVIEIKDAGGSGVVIYGSNNETLPAYLTAQFEKKDGRLKIYLKKRLVGRLNKGEEAVKRLVSYRNNLIELKIKYEKIK